MRFHHVHYYAVYAALVTVFAMCLSSGQCTVQGSEIVDVPEVIEELEDQQATIMTSLRAVDQRLQKQVQSMFQFLKSSLQQMKTQQDTAMTDLQADHRRFQEQVQSMFKSLKSSLQQMKNQQDSATTNLQAIDRCLSLCDTSIRNQTKALGTGNWIVIMHRFDGSLNFNRTWVEYKNGFGDKNGGEFWLGNEEVHRLTNRAMCTLRIEVQSKSSGVWYYAEYSTFSLESESNKYTLHVSGYSGNAGDALTNTSLLPDWYHGGMKFSTSDNDNDRWSDGNCARGWPGGWWYNKCHTACLTCHNLNEFEWYHHPGWPTSGRLRAARMMIKSK